MILEQTEVQIFHLLALGPMFLWVGIIYLTWLCLWQLLFLFNFLRRVTSAECGIPCRIAFSNSEIRDVYVIPLAFGMIGKLLLAEKHLFRSRHGVVIAIAPLAGLCVSRFCLNFLLARE
jgi:hypothetical protein